MPRCEAPQEIKPRQLGVGLKAGRQVGSGAFGVCASGLELGVGEQALRPEMVRLGANGLGEVADGVFHVPRLYCSSPVRK